MSQNVAYIGSRNYPLPYVDEEGNLKLLSNDYTYISLPVLFEGKPEDIQARVTGMLWRHLPTRGRLKSFLSDLRRRSKNIDSDQAVSNTFKHRRRAKLTLGMPGSGKTHKSKTLGKMVSPKGAIYVNCKDMDLKSLIVQTVLDTSNIDVEKNAIDARIKMYNKGDKTALSEDGIALLKKMFEGALTQDDESRISLDWAEAKNSAMFSSYGGDREFVSLLQQFCKREGIECTTNINNVGFVEKDGKLIEALESGRPIILDEINRGKNQDFLLPYLDFLNGGYESMDIEAANGRVVHLRKEDIPDTFMLEAIGNPETIEMGIKEKMSEPLKDRFDVEYTEDYTAKDFTDMFCSYATGVPISVIRDSFDIQTDKELSEVCMFLRTLGLTKEEKNAIPEDQKLYLARAGQFLAAAEIVGNSLYELYQYKKECTDIAKCEDQKLRQHIMDTSFSFRLIEDIFNRVKTYVPQNGDKLSKNPFLQYEFAAPVGQNTLEMRMENQGEAIEKSLKEVVKEIFWTESANPTLAKPVLGFANNILSRNGIGDEEYFEAKPIEQRRLKDLFTFTSNKGVSEEALKIQKIICDIIKESHPDLAGRPNDDLMDAEFIESYMADIRENQSKAPPVIGKIASVNVSNNSNNKTPFVETAVVETFGLISSQLAMDDVREEYDVKNLVNVKSFLATLTINTLSENNLEMIWPKMFAAYEQSTQKDITNEVIDILSGQSENILYNSFVFKNENDQKVALDIIQIPVGEKKETLIVGEEIDKVMSVRLKKKGITYVDRNDANAATTISNWMTKLDQSAYGNLAQAVKLKLSLPNDTRNDIYIEFMKPFDARNAGNMAHATTYLSSELSAQEYGNPQKVELQTDVFPIVASMLKLKGGQNGNC